MACSLVHFNFLCNIVGKPEYSRNVAGNIFSSDRNNTCKIGGSVHLDSHLGGASADIYDHYPGLLFLRNQNSLAVSKSYRNHVLYAIL